jgi:hypothetical protein
LQGNHFVLFYREIASLSRCECHRLRLISP